MSACMLQNPGSNGSNSPKKNKKKKHAVPDELKDLVAPKDNEP